MPRTFRPHDKKQNVPSFRELWQPVENVFIRMPPLEARGNRPLQMNFEHQLKAASILPREHAELGNLVAIDGSLIDAVLSMHWADYHKGCRKAKVHIRCNCASWHCRSQSDQKATAGYWLPR